MNQRSRRKRIPGAAFLVILCCAVPAQAQMPKMREIEYRAHMHSRGNLNVWNMAGSVRVTGWDRDSLVVRGVVPADQRFSCGGQAAAFKCAVDIAARHDGKVPGSTLEVFVPRHSRLWVKTSSAEILVSSFDGDLDAYSVNGRIRVDGNAQTLALETMAGLIDVLSDAVMLRAKTAGSDIRISGDIEDAQVASVSGSISIAASRMQRGRFESINGNTTWSGAVMARASLEFSSHSGTIELRLPATTGADVDVRSFEGDFRSDFTGTNRTRMYERKGLDLQFTLPGEHAARIAIRNFRGSIALLKQP